jgi:hypothetical protein
MLYRLTALTVNVHLVLRDGDHEGRIFVGEENLPDIAC